MATIVSADEIKKTLPNYSPNRAEEFHHESARQADKQFSRELKISKEQFVILMNGGTASGKTEFLVTHLADEQCVIFDATQSTVDGAQNKIREIYHAKKKPIIYSVIPDDLNRAFNAFLNRDRKFSDTHFYRTHAKSRETLLWAAKRYPDIEINLIQSSYANQKLQFSRLVFLNRNELIQYLESIQISETDIITLLT